MVFELFLQNLETDVNSGCTSYSSEALGINSYKED